MAKKDFYSIRNECLSRKPVKLWEDKEFDAVDRSLYYKNRPTEKIEWKRPKDIVKEPLFIANDITREDSCQGNLGDCWLAAGIAALATNRNVFLRVVPSYQSFSYYYAGIFHFWIWRYGTWIEVVVDDRLPTSNGKLIYMTSTDLNEFWSALLEKAYAKLFGSYEALVAGNELEAMVDFTGGLLELYNPKDPPPNFYDLLYKAFERGSLMCCSLMNCEERHGLLSRHAYTITLVHKMKISTPKGPSQLPMLRLRNPWGNDDTWNGPWSDNSPNWKDVPDTEKDYIQLCRNTEDGDFWISYEEFLATFGRIEICHLSPDVLDDSTNKRWNIQMIHGKWVNGVSAGGSRNHLDSFATNPQYRVKLIDVDEKDNEKKCTLIISLMQKNRRKLRNITGVGNLNTGFVVYRLPDGKELPAPLPKKFFEENQSVARSFQFVEVREVTGRFKLPPGSYCIVPSTFKPNEEGEFLLRVYSEKKNDMKEYDTQVKYWESLYSTPDSDNTEDENLTEKVKDCFLKFSGEDKEVDWLELKEILDHSLKKEGLSKGGFSKDICRSMMAMYDTDISGRMDATEFHCIWGQVCSLKRIYHRFREGPQGRLRTSKLKEALAAAGFSLTTQVLNMLARRYAGKDGKIHIDDFMMCAVKLKTMINHFNEKDVNNTNKAEFTLQDWILLTVGC